MYSQNPIFLNNFEDFTRVPFASLGSPEVDDELGKENVLTVNDFMKTYNERDVADISDVRPPDV